MLAEVERLRTLMQQMDFQAQGYPIGSGSVESAHKLVVQSRMKQAGMRWEPRHVDAMLAMRNLACNGRWGEGWLSIRQRWQQQRQTARELHVQTARAPSAAAAVPLVPPEDTLPMVSAVVQDLPTPSPTEPSASSARIPILPRGSRQAGTHCWQRPLLRRRST